MKEKKNHLGINLTQNVQNLRGDQNFPERHKVDLNKRNTFSFAQDDSTL